MKNEARLAVSSQSGEEIASNLGELEFQLGTLPKDFLTLDVRNLLCPMPVIRLQNSMKNVLQGQYILVLCTDPGTKSDIPTWCRINDHKVSWIREEGFEIHFLVKV